MDNKNDFSKGDMKRNILSMTIPMMTAQLIHLLYNIVDRMYIGRIPDVGVLALTGVGLTFPVITIISGFANLYGVGGGSLCSIARGRCDTKEAKNLMQVSYSMLIITGIIVSVLCFLFMKPLLYVFGASDVTYVFASDYLKIYILGTIFVMAGLGMNSFISSQGFGKTAMFTVLCGAIINIVLDPIFIFVFNMGVKGAAYATVISQIISAIWVLKFLTGRKAILRLDIKKFYFDSFLIKRITAMGFSSFVMSFTTSAVQVISNSQLQIYGGDIYVGIMTVVNSIREILTLPLNGVMSGAPAVIGYNYGAAKFRRVKDGIKFMTFISVVYSLVVWALIIKFPSALIRIFNNDPQLIALGIPAIKAHFFGFFMMSFQIAGQTCYVSLGKAKHAIFFSMLRKAVIVIPLTFLLPHLWGLGPMGVFWSEPVSNVIGGMACYLTFMLTIWPKLTDEKKDVCS